MPSNELQENGRLQVFVIAEICAKSHVCIRARTVFTDKKSVALFDNIDVLYKYSPIECHE